ncbi:MAG TPA: hypothetical protein VGD74_02645 [Vulgatibacter sp.]
MTQPVGALRLAAIAAALALGGCVASTAPSFPIAGEPCDPAAPDVCHAGSFCLRLEVGGICTVACADDLDCPSGLTCQADGRLEALVCKPGLRCTSDAACPSGHRCDTGRGSCFIPVQRGLCAPCTNDAQCPEGGLCFRARGSGERFCTSPCVDGCPDGYQCRTLPGKERIRQCVPEAETCYAGRPLCSPCRGDAECADGTSRCIENLLTGERFCGKSCRTGCKWIEGLSEWRDEVTGEPCRSGCPRNFTCTEIASHAGSDFQCVPNAATCGGFCDASDPRGEMSQCGPGRSCDREAHVCRPADDGRACSPCTDDDRCNVGGQAGALCLANVHSGETFCAPACRDRADCAARWGAGFDCMEVEGERVCVPLQATCIPGVGGLGAACSLPAACLSGICLRYGSIGLCSAPCAADAECGDSRYRCCAVVPGEGGGTIDCEAPVDGGAGVCAPNGGGFGDDCDPGQPPCQDGYCLDIGTARLCTSACDDDRACDEASRTSGGFTCRQARAVDPQGDAADPVNVCFPAGGGELGADCTFGPAACAHRLCIKKESGNVCTKPCEGADCPAGWTCADARTVDGRTARICLPE